MGKKLQPKGYDPDLVPRDDPGRANWETFCREIGRLLDEGYLGHMAYLKGGRIVAIYRNFRHFVESTRHETELERIEPSLIQPILWELPEQLCLNRHTYMPPIKLLPIENEVA
jgi:hypothetical protein